MAPFLYRRNPRKPLSIDLRGKSNFETIKDALK